MIEAKNPAELEYYRCNLVLREVYDWVSQNGLKLNIGKTNLLYFTNNYSQKNTPLSISLNGTPINKSTNAKFLGVIMDENLNWNHHIAALASKVSRNSGILYKLREILPAKALRNLYFSFIESHLLYCSSVWGTVPKSRISILFSAQKKAIRAISFARVNFFYDPINGKAPSHTKPLFKSQTLLALPNLIAKTILGILQKVRLGVAPSNIKNFFQQRVPGSAAHATRHDHTKLFENRFFRLSRSNFQISHVGPKLYNHISQLASRKQTLNKGIADKRITDKFYDPFRKEISKILLNIQSLPVLDKETNEWGDTNFPLYLL